MKLPQDDRNQTTLRMKANQQAKATYHDEKEVAQHQMECAKR